MIEIYKSNSKKELQKIESYQKDSWIRITNPDSDEINKIIQDLNLDKDLVVDGLDINELPRIEKENGATYIFLSTPTKKISDESTSSFLMVITENYFITISRNNLEIFNKIVDGKISFITGQKSRNLMKILYLVSREFDLNVRRIFKQIKADKKQINKLSNQDILDLVLQEDVLNDYNFYFRPMISIYETILKDKSIKFSDSDKEFIEDLIVDLNQTSNANTLALKTISNMRGYYSTTLSNRLNNIITLLTVFTIFLAIPTAIAGIYGMNISLPFQNHPNILLFLGTVVLTMWVIFFLIIKKMKII